MSSVTFIKIKNIYKATHGKHQTLKRLCTDYLIFGMHNHVGSDCAIGFMILTFEVYGLNKFLCKVLSGVLLAYYVVRG